MLPLKSLEIEQIELFGAVMLKKVSFHILDWKYSLLKSILLYLKTYEKL